MLDPEVRALLEGANFVHLSTLMADGSPHATVVWGHTRGEQAIFFTNNPQSLKGRNIARDPRVAMSLIDRDNPYRTGMLRGTVVGTLTGDEADAIVDETSHKYMGRPFPLRGNTVYLIEVARSSFTKLPFKDTPPG